MTGRRLECGGARPPYDSGLPNSDSGQPITFNFCPVCGSTVYWELSCAPGFAIAVGMFADPTFPQPRHSVYDDCSHPWVFAAGELPLEHLA